MILARILAVVSAMFMVAAFTLATMLPPDMPLSQAISLANHGWLVSLQDVVLKHVSPWVWTNLVVPVLLRPVWIMPITLGMVTAGIAVTLSSRRGSPNSRRRRS